MLPASAALADCGHLRLSKLPCLPVCFLVLKAFSSRWQSVDFVNILRRIGTCPSAFCRPDAGECQRILTNSAASAGFPVKWNSGIDRPLQRLFQIAHVICLLFFEIGAHERLEQQLLRGHVFRKADLGVRAVLNKRAGPMACLLYTSRCV